MTAQKKKPPASTSRVMLQLPHAMREQVDEARKTPGGTIARNEWIRRAIEVALAEAKYGPAPPH